MTAISIYSLRNPYDDRFATAGRRGTWHCDDDVGICPKCNASTESRVKPLIIEWGPGKWEPGSDLIGDFTRVGSSTDIMVSDRVREYFQDRYKGLEFGDVEMIQNPRLKRPTRKNKRTKPRVWLPYEGPPLWDMWVTEWCHFDMERSAIWVERECATCKQRGYAHTEGAPAVVDVSTWSGAAIFRAYERPGCVMVTEEVKRLIEEDGFTNVSFEEEGYIPGGA